MSSSPKLDTKAYEKELLRLQTELVAMTEWVKQSGTRVVAIFEGRDAAGKGGSIKRIAQLVSPRICRIVALPAPTERERTQWYFQRYVSNLPSGGEIMLFDRSWYNRAGVERVMDFCTDEQYERFLSQVPTFERMLVNDGIILLKYWFSVSDDEQQRRFQRRLEDPTKQWKLSPMDLESIGRYVDYSRAKDVMFERTDIPEARWHVVESDDKKASRLNCIAHLLSQVPYARVELPKVKLPKPQADKGYVRPPRNIYAYVPDHASATVPLAKVKEVKKA
jgi:polyphosphate kinase